MKVQEAVRRETGRVALHVVLMTLVMLAIFLRCTWHFRRKSAFLTAQFSLPCRAQRWEY